MTRTFKVSIDTENEAFRDDREVARILREVADKVEAGESFTHARTLFDSNGNDVGRAKLYCS